MANWNLVTSAHRSHFLGQGHEHHFDSSFFYFPWLGLPPHKKSASQHLERISLHTHARAPSLQRELDIYLACTVKSWIYWSSGAVWPCEKCDRNGDQATRQRSHCHWCPIQFWGVRVKFGDMWWFHFSANIVSCMLFIDTYYLYVTIWLSFEWSTFWVLGNKRSAVGVGNGSVQ